MNKKLVFDFLKDDLTSIQRKNLEQWLNDPANAEEFYMYLDEYESEHMQYEVNVEEKLRVVKGKLRKEQTDKGITTDSSWFSGRRPPLFVAAAVTILLLIGTIWFNTDQKPDSIALQKSTLPLPDHHEQVEKINQGDLPFTVVLPDNSSVILQPESKISYSTADFKEGNRVVYFDGTGFFEVAKNPDSPFIVNTNHFSTRVLGTSFTLKTSKNSSDNEIVVKTGKVAVFKVDNTSGKDTGEPVFLLANQKLQFSKGSPLVPVMISKKDLDKPAESLSFEFDERPVSEVFEILSSAYHVKIDYEKKDMKDCKITAFLSDEPLYEKIRLICFALDARYEINNKTIIITSPGC